MLFQTPTFGLFLILVVIGATLFDRRATLHQLFLLTASYLFYGAWDWRFLGLILFSTALDYSVGLGIQRSTTPRVRKALLIASLVGNLGVLGMFKYHDFFAENLNALFARLGVELSTPVLHLILPVGISFYTFQTLSYTIDIYRGDLEARTSFLKVALFVAFFPQLVAGPIVRARQFLPQLDRRPEYSRESSGSGLYLILKGLTKKVVVADVIGAFLVNPVWAEPSGYGWAWILLATFGFMFQIYGDFAGYSDIAIGCGRLLGFELPQNFDSPYKASSVADYWSRWHMTLGSWFRDYLYFPLGGSRGSAVRTGANLVVVMVLIGLWHGAAWTFVLFGAIHGLYLIVGRSFRGQLQALESRSAALRFARVVMTFLLCALAAIVFRAPALESIWGFLGGLSRPAEGLGELPVGVWAVLSFAVFTHFAPERWKSGCERGFARWPVPLQTAAVVVCILLMQKVATTVEPFYYFQF